MEFVHIVVCTWAVNNKNLVGEMKTKTKSAGLLLRRFDVEGGTGEASWHRVGLVMGPDDDVGVEGKEWERKEFVVI